VIYHNNYKVINNGYNMNIQQLVDIGFTENQAKVYLSLFKKPGSGAGEISKKISLDRSFVYSIIESLIKKGLVYSSLIKNKRVFYSENPGRIIDELNEKKFKVEKILEELDKLKQSDNQTPKIEIYEGKTGLKKYLNEIIASKEFLTLGGGGNLNIFNILKYEHPHYFNSLKKAKISGKIICSAENKGFWRNNLKDTLIQVKSLKGSGKENSITILKDKLLFSLEEENPHVIVINNKDHAHSLRHYFSYLWNIAKE